MLVAVGLKKSDKKKRPPVRVNHQIDIYLIHTYSLSLFLFNFNQKKKVAAITRLSATYQLLIFHFNDLLRYHFT